MKRMLLPMVVCLALGAVLVVASAWAFALYAGLGTFAITYEPPEPGSRLSSASRVPADFVQGTHVRRTARAGVLRTELVTEMVWMGSKLAWMSDRQNRSVERVAVGWPMPALEWIGSMDLRHCKDEWTWRDGLTPAFRDEHLTEGARRRLPLVPLWPGFALNVLFFASIPAAFWLVIPHLQRTSRRKRGCCPACAYELQGLTTCPECGRSDAPIARP